MGEGICECCLVFGQNDNQSGIPSRTQRRPCRPTLLEKVDKLFACNVGEYIDLPQLVVVGDQSSGKSLEGLTKLKFPRNTGLCTRFATQNTFQRDPSLSKRKISGSIIFASGDSEAEDRRWNIPDIDALNNTQFEKMMTEVCRSLIQRRSQD